jgi:hypothetical protein
VGRIKQGFSLTSRTLAALWVVLLASAERVEAQVGLTSATAQVAMVARITPHGSIQGVSWQHETGGNGSVREASVIVRLAANTGYQLMVRGTGAHKSRIWVRSVNGEFQELTAGSSVMVARDTRCAGHWDREVHYRIESTDAADQNEQPLPVRYEIAVNPTL